MKTLLQISFQPVKMVELNSVAVSAIKEVRSTNKFVHSILPDRTVPEADFMVRSILNALKTPWELSGESYRIKGYVIFNENKSTFTKYSVVKRETTKPLTPTDYESALEDLQESFADMF